MSLFFLFRSLNKEGQRNSRDFPPLNVDDNALYQPHSDSEESEEKGPIQANISHFKHRLRGSGSEGEIESPADGEGRDEEREVMGSSNEDIIIEHVSSALPAGTMYVSVASIF